MESVKRIFVEKREDFDIEAQKMLKDIKEELDIKGLEGLRLLNRYDMEGLDEELFEKVRTLILSEPTVDRVYCEEFDKSGSDAVFAVEYLPGQYDQRADSASQCIQILSGGERIKVKSAKVIVLSGKISEEELQEIKDYIINPVDSREAGTEKPQSLWERCEIPKSVDKIEGFSKMGSEELDSLRLEMGLSMDLDDLDHCATYFGSVEQRDPTVTEIRVLDTYWSDHCRHTTFNTEIKDIEIAEGPYREAIEKAYSDYLDSRKAVYGEDESSRPICLMDMAVIAMKEMRASGELEDLEVSDEINACSMEVDADLDGKLEKWLVMFKNETHNHPTEIEPFGGAATCLGGAIRDPLSGRSYVYQAMRVTGSGDPRTPVKDTIPGKLPQRKITTEAAHGFSSYGNQIGLATGKVSEVYDSGFVAKRMEIGAVIAAAPRENVLRLDPKAGDVVLLVGGATGRDGCGGATGSSKQHTEESISSSGAEVQKGNAPEERKIQRLFRMPEAAKMIKKCNDFGAGGVSVAIGELASSIDIYLNKVPKKYDGLDGTEIAISESQERMAVVVESEDVEEFRRLARLENLEAVHVADITDTGRLRMDWNGEWILDIERDFLDSNGAKKESSSIIESPGDDGYFKLDMDSTKSLKELWLENLSDLNVADQKGLAEMFDSSVGASSVLMPYGGLYEDTPAEGMAAKLPVLYGDTSTATIMAHGYNPNIGRWSPFHGGMYSVLESVAKVVSMGGSHKKARLTLQEYFEKLGDDPGKWGKPVASLLGALQAQKMLRIPAIGGKDSMSGTFENLSVPPTLVSFAVAVADVKDIISPELKRIDSKLVLLKVDVDRNHIPDFSSVDKTYTKVTELIRGGKIISAHTVGHGGIAAAVSKMAFGNRVGVRIEDENSVEELFYPYYGGIVAEVARDFDIESELQGLNFKKLGNTCGERGIYFKGESIALSEALESWREPLKQVFPYERGEREKATEVCYDRGSSRFSATIKTAKPKVLVPCFPGTNSEYDTARAFIEAGGDAEIFVFRNLSPRDIEQSVEQLAKKISESQIVAIPGGFSAGDEPDGSGKFIATVFRNEIIAESVMELLNRRDGLMLGICNGFQALVKLGLLPYGEIRELEQNSPTLTFNGIGKHVAKMARTKVVSNLSPWMALEEVGRTHSIAISHGEGRFVADGDVLETLVSNGQIATQYVDEEGNVCSGNCNPNGSKMAIEGITSPDGRVFGKMGHSERYSKHAFKNIIGNKEQRIFEAGIKYFK